MITLIIDTPETQEAIERWRQGKINIFDEMARMERERDEARKELKHISEYGTEEINAAVDLRQRLATALVERDEARAALKIKQ